MHLPSGAMVAVGRIDDNGNVTAVENSGAAWCGETKDADEEGAGKAVSAPLPAPARLETIRDSVAQGVHLGWGLPLASGSRVVTQRLVPAVSRRAASRLNRSWDALANCDLLLGCAPIPGGPSERRLVAEVALVNCPPEQLALFQSVLSAVLPHIAARFRHALGRERHDRRDWLTAREEAILWRLVAGKKVPQIAEELHRSIYTVHDHVKSLHRKLGASNRGQLVSRALGHLGPLVADAADAMPDDSDDDGSSSTPRRSTLVR
ncbi:MAG: response regulator transcription factor [Phycisphaerales bacterium]